jgi:hypothetical protein
MECDQTSHTYRVRYRFRVQKRFSISEAIVTVQIAGRKVELKSQERDGLIKDSDWLVLSAGDFESEGAARSFSEKLKLASEISSVASRLGIDSGLDRKTGHLADMLKEVVRTETGAIVRDNVHGVDIFVDDPNTVFFNVNIQGHLSTDPERFLKGLSDYFVDPTTVSQRGKDILVLLNYALTRTDPIAQMVFAISAVEMLGQQEKWSHNQQQLLKTLAVDALNSATGTQLEREEVASAIRRNTHKIGLIQGVVRLLDAYGLAALKKPWRDMYAKRSTLVHGLAPKPGVDYGPQAFETISLCGRILLTVLAPEVPAVRVHLDLLYGDMMNVGAIDVTP